MDLGLAIPVRDDADGLARLVRQAAAHPFVSLILIVDDASDPPVAMAALPAAPARTVLIRQTPQDGRGAGAARNLALDAVHALGADAPTHLMFFDADDMLGPELGALWQALERRGPGAPDFDFCLFKHADSRIAGWNGHAGGAAQIPADEALWQAAGVAGTALSGPLSPAALGRLAQTSNFPWNKIYRTGFLREAGLRCSQTPVHNDIELHWTSFAAARTVLASDRVGAVHHVAARGDRLTNRQGAERLSAFLPLDALAARFCGGPADGAPPGPWCLPFLRWTAAFFDWMRGNLDPALVPRFDRRAARFVQARVPPPLFETLLGADRLLARRLVLLLARAGLPDPAGSAARRPAWA